MRITTPESAEPVPFNLEGRKMFSNDKVELVHLTIKPDEEIALHVNPFDVIFYILEGNGTVLYDETSSSIKAETSVFIEKGRQRGIRNDSKNLLRFLVFKIF